MRKLFVSTTHWLADATDASVPSAAKASRRRALLQPSILDDLPAQRPALSNSVPGCNSGLHKHCIEAVKCCSKPPSSYQCFQQSSIHST